MRVASHLMATPLKCTQVLFPQTLGGAITFAIGQSIFQVR
jgi:hypothetical protein